MRRVLFIGLLFLILFGTTDHLSAHRINVFCWVEGTKAKCEASFTPGGPVRGGEISVWVEGEKEPIIKGKTDKKGLFEFTIPEDVIKK